MTPSSRMQSPSASPTADPSTSPSATVSSTSSPSGSASGDDDQGQTTPDARGKIDNNTDPGSGDGRGDGDPADGPTSIQEPRPTQMIPATVMTPAMEGVVEADAVAALARIGLDAEVTYQPSDTVPSGIVISASVEEGTAVALGTVVALVVSGGSGGEGLIDLPSYVGTPSDEARAELEALGLVVVTTAEHSIAIAPGSVISQSPDTGQASPGDTVTLVVSDGPELLAVPDVMGMSGAAACDAIDAVGFTCQIVCDLENCDSDGFLDRVARIAPEAGTMVYQGFSVTVHVV
ncbi:MAG: PASTA domain-containing protein [Propionibacteriaceae bacterium]|nr:PASTA domain-containing protein [Propionibacteriaceae bacterium]